MIDLPPPPFDRPYDGPVIEHILSADEIAAMCGRNTMACMWKPSCHIWLPKVGPGGVTQQTQDLLRRHEQGHCNGWRH